MAPVLSGSPAPVWATAAGITSLTTASFTPPVGSIIVAKVFTGDGATTSSVPTGTGLTFTSRLNVGTSGSTCRDVIYTAVGNGTATTVTATFGGQSSLRGLVVEVWTGAQLAATPVTSSTLRATNPSAASASITTAAAGSVVSWMLGDWSAVSGASRTYRQSAVDDGYTTLSGQATFYSAYQQAATAGAQQYGLSAPSNNWMLAAIEIQASAATAQPDYWGVPA